MKKQTNQNRENSSKHYDFILFQPRVGRYLDDLNAQCTQKSNDFEARQQLRAEELEAIQKAIEILASGSVSGMADKHLPALVQSAPVFVQRLDLQGAPGNLFLRLRKVF